MGKRNIRGGELASFGEEDRTRKVERIYRRLACLSTGDVLCENKERRNKGGKEGGGGGGDLRPGACRGGGGRRQNASGWKGGWRKMEGEE